MRKINTTDVFEALRLIQKSGLKDKLVPIVKDLATKKETDVIDTGILGMLSVIEVFAEKKCEAMIYELLAGPFEVSADEVAKMDLAELSEKLEQLGEENDLAHFFTVLSKLLMKKQ